MSPSFKEHLLLEVDPPGRIVSDIIVVFRSIVNSAFSARDCICLQCFCDNCFCFFNLLEVVSILFPVDIVGIFIVAEGGSTG